MLNKVCTFIRANDLLKSGDHVICALSGGADSVALLWTMYLLREKLSVTVSAAHYNHGLRGEESDRDQRFAEEFCARYDIPLYVGSGHVQAGEKGLEAAARDARYAFFNTLPGKIATAHTADDNTETLLINLVRGTGLKGLGGIAPVRGNVVRPMLSVTRQEVISFLEEYSLPYVEDSSNLTDQFLRNRVRHHVMPLLRQENPSIAENVSAMALRLRQDEQILNALAEGELPDVPTLRQLTPALRSRYLASFLEKCGVKEPSSEHIALAESLVFSKKPSAKAVYPNGITVCRQYDRLEKQVKKPVLTETVLNCPGVLELPEIGLRIHSRPATDSVLHWTCFTVFSVGKIRVRSRNSGDSVRLNGGRKSLKELLIDRKIPAAERDQIPVIVDDLGVLGVWGIGANLDRISGNGLQVEIRFEEI